MPRLTTLLLLLFPLPTLAADPDTLLATKSLDPQSQIVLVRGPVAPATTVLPILNTGEVQAQTAGQPTNIYTLRLELRTKGRPPFLLASRVRLEGLAADVGFEVLDLDTRPGQIAAICLQGENLAVWVVDVANDYQSTWELLSLRSWSAGPTHLLQPLPPKTIKGKLTRDANNRFYVEVIDTRATPEKHSYFEQQGHSFMSLKRPKP